MAGTPSDIIKIGNSQGLRIPKSLLQQTALNGPVELDVLDGQLLIRPVGELPAVNQSSASIGLKVVTVGGGTGGFMLLSALRHYANNITAIVNMSDDGGSTGILRDELGILPPGDIRQCLVALSTTPEYMRELLNYRFEEGSLKGHAFGNLFLTALEQVGGSFAEGVKLAEQILQVRGRVLPVTTDNVRVIATFPHGEVVEGEHALQGHNFKGEQPTLTLSPSATLTNDAALAINEADLIVVGPGDLYSSLIPSLLPKGMARALRNSKATKIYVCNLVNKPLTTKGLQVHDYVETLEAYIGENAFDYVIYNTALPDPAITKHYLREGETPILHSDTGFAGKSYTPIGEPLLTNGEAQKKNDTLINRNLIRHNGDRLARAIMKAYFS